MQNERITISPLLYYTLTSSLTTLVFIAAGIFALALFSVDLTNPAVIIVTIVLLGKGVPVGFVTWFWYKRSHNKELAVKFIGFYLGRFFGLIFGGFLGARIADMFRQAEIIGILAGALALYFTGRWIGSGLSATVSGQLDKVFALLGTQEPERSEEAKPLEKSFRVLYIVVLPLLFAVIGLFINYFRIPVGPLFEWLPISRIIAIALSILAIGYPWLMRRRGSIKFESAASSQRPVIPWLGLSLSFLPAVYGWILFIGMGASVIELCLFAATSSIAALIWSANDPIRRRQRVH